MPHPTPGRLADGQPITLLASLSDPAEVSAALAAGAEGAGLLRTEFVFAGRRTPPSVAEQHAIYAAVFDAFGDRRVVVRVLDPGPHTPFLTAGREPNPALGVRGIRALRRQPQVLENQLAALARAAHDTRAEVWAMAPMVTDVDDATWFVAQARAAGLARPGVVVEVPAAALTAGNLLRVASFACVSSDDLTQYALAADRQVAALSAWRDPWHPAVLRLVELVGAAGSLSGKPVSVCGSAAADPLLACVLVGLGVTSLSVPPPGLARVRAGLAQHTFGDCLAFTDLALGASTAVEARTRVASVARA